MASLGGSARPPGSPHLGGLVPHAPERRWGSASQDSKSSRRRHTLVAGPGSAPPLLRPWGGAPWTPPRPRPWGGLVTAPLGATSGPTALTNGTQENASRLRPRRPRPL
eukprot:13537593-Alexandrium_andersonii.AAC.1